MAGSENFGQRLQEIQKILIRVLQPLHVPETDEGAGGEHSSDAQDYPEGVGRAQQYVDIHAIERGYESRHDQDDRQRRHALHYIVDIIRDYR